MAGKGWGKGPQVAVCAAVGRPGWVTGPHGNLRGILKKGSGPVRSERCPLRGRAVCCRKYLRETGGVTADRGTPCSLHGAESLGAWLYLQARRLKEVRSPTGAEWTVPANQPAQEGLHMERLRPSGDLSEDTPGYRSQGAVRESHPGSLTEGTSTGRRGNWLDLGFTWKVEPTGLTETDAGEREALPPC